MSVVLKVIDNFARILRARKTNVLVYQMGKVGSSSLYRSIDGSCQLHTLSGESSRKFSVSFYQHNILRFVINNLRWKIISVLLYRNIKTRKTRMKVLTVVRDPVARNISAFFENLEEKVHQKYSSVELLELFWSSSAHLAPLYWFDVELKRYLNLDVVCAKYDPEQGVGYVSNEKFDLIVIKLEKLKDSEREIASFIGAPSFKLVSANVAAEKWYSDKYKGFLGAFQPTEEYLSLMYSCSWVRKFYSDKEIQGFRSKWTRGAYDK